MTIPALSFGTPSPAKAGIVGFYNPPPVICDYSFTETLIGTTSQQDSLSLNLHPSLPSKRFYVCVALLPRISLVNFGEPNWNATNGFQGELRLFQSGNFICKLPISSQQITPVTGFLNYFDPFTGHDYNLPYIVGNETPWLGSPQSLPTFGNMIWWGDVPAVVPVSPPYIQYGGNWNSQQLQWPLSVYSVNASKIFYNAQLVFAGNLQNLLTAFGVNTVFFPVWGFRLEGTFDAATLFVKSAAAPFTYLNLTCLSTNSQPDTVGLNSL